MFQKHLATRCRSGFDSGQLAKQGVATCLGDGSRIDGQALHGGHAFHIESCQPVDSHAAAPVKGPCWAASACLRSAGSALHAREHNPVGVTALRCVICRHKASHPEI